jgi:hypothetical protein
MRSAIIRTAILSVLAIPAAAFAQAAAPAIKAGIMVVSADGKRVGRIYDVHKKDGAITAVSIIRDSRIIHINASTLSPSEKGLTTTMSSADIAKLK